MASAYCGWLSWGPPGGGGGGAGTGAGGDGGPELKAATAVWPSGPVSSTLAVPSAEGELSTRAWASGYRLSTAPVRKFGKAFEPARR